MADSAGVSSYSILFCKRPSQDVNIDLFLRTEDIAHSIYSYFRSHRYLNKKVHTLHVLEIPNYPLLLSIILLQCSVVHSQQSRSPQRTLQPTRRAVHSVSLMSSSNTKANPLDERNKEHFPLTLPSTPPSPKTNRQMRGAARTTPATEPNRRQEGWMPRVHDGRVATDKGIRDQGKRESE